MSHWLRQINDWWFQSKVKAEQQELKQFELLMDGQAAGQHINLICVAINYSETLPQSITELGLSIWFGQNSLMENISYHWHVQENIETKDSVDFRNPDAFDFGTTIPITAGDVRTVLDDWVLSLSNREEQVCLVFFGKQQMQALENHWKPSVPVTFLDLEVVWRLQAGGPADATFKEAACSISGIESVANDLDNAGNRAYYLMRMIRLNAKEKREGLPKTKESI